jgi:hypothetical protein
VDEPVILIFKYSKSGTSKSRRRKKRTVELSDEGGSEYSPKKDVHSYEPGFAYRERRLTNHHKFVH